MGGRLRGLRFGDAPFRLRFADAVALLRLRGVGGEVVGRRLVLGSGMVGELFQSRLVLLKTVCSKSWREWKEQLPGLFLDRRAYDAPVRARWENFSKGVCSCYKQCMVKGKSSKGKDPGFIRKTQGVIRVDLIASAFERDRLYAWYTRHREWLGMDKVSLEKELDPDLRATLKKFANKKPAKKPVGPTSETAFRLGTALGCVQAERGVPREQCVSGLHALAAGGYYIDLVGTIGIALRDHGKDPEVRDVARRYVATDFQHFFALPALSRGATEYTMAPNYAKAVSAEGHTGLYVGDEGPFRTSFDYWVSHRTIDELSRDFGIVLFCFAIGYVPRGLELFELAVLAFLAPYERQQHDEDFMWSATYHEDEDDADRWREAEENYVSPDVETITERTELHGPRGSLIAEPREMFDINP